MHILLIEDNRIEIMKMKRAISFLKLKHTIVSKTDGEAALRYLKKGARKRQTMYDLSIKNILCH